MPSLQSQFKSKYNIPFKPHTKEYNRYLHHIIKSDPLRREEHSLRCAIYRKQKTILEGKRRLLKYEKELRELVGEVKTLRIKMRKRGE